MKDNFLMSTQAMGSQTGFKAPSLMHGKVHCPLSLSCLLGSVCTRVRRVSGHGDCWVQRAAVHRPCLRTMVIQNVSAVNRLSSVMETTDEHTANVFISSCYLSPLEKYWATLKGFSLYSQSVRAKLSVLGCWESVDTQMKSRRNTQNFMNFSFLPSWLGRTPLKLM